MEVKGEEQPYQPGTQPSTVPSEFAASQPGAALLPSPPVVVSHPTLVRSALLWAGGLWGKLQPGSSHLR